MSGIIHAPQQVLTQQAKPVLLFDKKLEKLVTLMKRTLLSTRDPKGVGLAAPQIGESCRLFITKPTEKAKIRVFINPEITWRSDEADDTIENDSKKLEGCLSIPKVWGKVKRAKAVRLKFQDELGERHEELFEKFMATIVQHETDHINGILFTQRVMEQKGMLYVTTKDKEGKEVLEELDI